MIASSTSLSLSLAVVLIFAAAAVSAKTLAAENCELGASCENEIDDDDDVNLEDDFGFSFDDLTDFGEEEEDEEEGFGSEGDVNNLPRCSELTYFEVELGTGADGSKMYC